MRNQTLPSALANGWCVRRGHESLVVASRREWPQGKQFEYLKLCHFAKYKYSGRGSQPISCSSDSIRYHIRHRISILRYKLVSTAHIVWIVVLTANKSIFSSSSIGRCEPNLFMPHPQRLLFDIPIICGDHQKSPHSSSSYHTLHFSVMAARQALWQFGYALSSCIRNWIPGTLGPRAISAQVHEQERKREKEREREYERGKHLCVGPWVGSIWYSLFFLRPVTPALVKCVFNVRLHYREIFLSPLAADAL